MKNRKIIKSILKFIFEVLAVASVICLIGSVGACEHNNITILQMIVQIIISVITLYISCMGYLVASNINTSK